MILLTGASGFIGKHLLHRLIEKYGAGEVLALTSKPLDSCRYSLHRNYSFEQKDIAGADKITTVIHAGAFIPKSRAEADDVAACNRNIYFTEQLLALDLPRLQKIIFLSSVDVYGNDELITERSLTDPGTLYGDSKLYCEKIVAAWARQNNKKSEILRLGHVYGPGEEHFQKLIPLTFKKILKSEPIEIWGKGEETRAFIFIEDVVTAIVNSIDNPHEIAPVNLVSSQAVSVVELIQKMLLVTGAKTPIRFIESSHTPRSLKFDNSKLMKHLLKQETSLDDGLNKEYAYFKTLEGITA